MQQSNVIFATLLIAYIIFITMKGELSLYLTLLRGGGQQPGNAGTGASDPITSLFKGAANLMDSTGVNGPSTSGGIDSFIPGTPFVDNGEPLPALNGGIPQVN